MRLQDLLLEAAREDWGALLTKEEAGVARLLHTKVGLLQHTLLRKRAAANKALSEAAEKSPLQLLVGDMKGRGARRDRRADNRGRRRRWQGHVVVGSLPAKRWTRNRRRGFRGSKETRALLERGRFL